MEVIHTLCQANPHAPLKHRGRPRAINGISFALYNNVSQVARYPEVNDI